MLAEDPNILPMQLLLCYDRQFSSVQFSPLTDWVIGGGEGELEGRISGDPLPVFSAGGPFEQFQHGQGCPAFDVVHPTFPLPTMAPTL